MASMSNYLEDKIANLLFNATAFTAPTAYVALYTTAPSDAGGGTEVTGGSYARVDSSANWPVLSGGGTLSNDVAITFPTATADWGTVTHVGILDAAGNLLFHGALAASKVVTTDDTFSFAVGDLDITFD